MGVYKKTILPLFLLIFLHISELIMDKIHIFYYCDELYSVLFAGIIVFTLFNSKKKRNLKKIKKILLMCFIMLIIGIFSNLRYGMQPNIIAVLLDIVANFKFPLCLIGYYLIIDKDIAKDIIKFFHPLSKAFIIISFLCSIISIFLDIGMRGQFRFGIWGYEFLYSYAHIFSMVLLFNLIIVAICIKDEKKFIIYLVMTLIQLVLTTKGTSIVAAAVIPFVMMLIKKNNKLKIKNFIPMGIIGVLLGNYQIKTYFMNQNTPRALILKYSIENIKKFFPFGSGFASYGSDMANKYYSNLYKFYGFNRIWGMHEGSLFLNDNYWPMIIGQFGIIGLACCIYMLYIFFSVIQECNLNNKVKAIVLSCFIYMLIASLGTTIFTTSATILLGLGMLVAITYSVEDNNIKEIVNIKEGE